MEKMTRLGEFLIKLVAKKLAKIDSSTFDKVVTTVSEVGQNPDFTSGLEQAEQVIKVVKPDFDLPDHLFWIIDVVVKLAYTVARLKGLPT